MEKKSNQSNTTTTSTRSLPISKHGPTMFAVTARHHLKMANRMSTESDTSTEFCPQIVLLYEQIMQEFVDDIKTVHEPHTNVVDVQKNLITLNDKDFKATMEKTLEGTTEDLFIKKFPLALLEQIVERLTGEKPTYNPDLTIPSPNDSTKGKNSTNNIHSRQLVLKMKEFFRDNRNTK